MTSNDSQTEAGAQIVLPYGRLIPDAMKRKSRMEERDDGKFLILSIDGGGIPGIIPTMVLSHLENDLDIKDLAGTFDLIAGTSVGGIIAMSLTASQDNLKTNDILQIFDTRPQEIFKPNPRLGCHICVLTAHLLPCQILLS